MDVRLTRTDCDEAGVYVVPNVLSPRDLVSRPDNMVKNVLHIYSKTKVLISSTVIKKRFSYKDSAIPLFPKT